MNQRLRVANLKPRILEKYLSFWKKKTDGKIFTSAHVCEFYSPD